MNSALKKRKILFISYSAYPLFHPNTGIVHGGAEVDTYNIASYLDQKKFEIHFIVGDFGQKKLEKINGITIHAAQKINNSSLFSGLHNTILLFLLIKKISPDIIFSKSLGWLTIELILIKIFLRKKFVFRSSHRKNIDGSADKKPYGKAFRMLIQNIDHFFIQNQEDQRILKNTYSFKGPITHIPNLHPIGNGEIKKHKERKYFLWIGRSESIKNPEGYLEIAKLFPNDSFRMVLTETNKEVYKSIQLKAKNIPNISIIKKMPHSEILEYISNAKYIITTSTGEGFPNILIEAFSKGTPVISLHIDFDNIIKEKNVGFLGDGSVNSLKSFIDKTTDTKWDTLSQNAHALATNYFNIDKRITEYEKIFLQI